LRCRADPEGETPSRHHTGAASGKHPSAKDKVKLMSKLLDPKPGSPEAIAQGCTCPPRTGPDFVGDQNCPVHAASDWVEPCPHGHIDPDDCPACNPD
jgi:hypothetical protein